MRFNRNLYPPDSYVFTDTDGVLVRGDSWRDLIRKVKERRQVAGRPPGDIDSEIDNQHCAKYPGLCHGDPPPPPVQRPGNTLNSRVLSWFTVMIAKTRQFGALGKVSDAEAQRRIAICASCPRQVAFSTACESCVTAVKGGRKILLADKTPLHQGLHPCSVLGEDTVASVHLNEPPVNDPALPENCWRRHGPA